MTKLTALILVEWMDVDGYCRPARDSIADRARICDRTVDKATYELEAAGLLCVKRGRGRKHVNEYQAVLKREPRSRFGREKANEPPVKGEPRSQELVRTSSARPAGAARAHVNDCLTCGERFTSPDDAAVFCQAHRGGEAS